MAVGEVLEIIFIFASRTIKKIITKLYIRFNAILKYEKENLQAILSGFHYACTDRHVFGIDYHDIM